MMRMFRRCPMVPIQCNRSGEATRLGSRCASSSSEKRRGPVPGASSRVPPPADAAFTSPAGWAGASPPGRARGHGRKAHLLGGTCCTHGGD